jgi:hypothetical protein
VSTSEPATRARRGAYRRVIDTSREDVMRRTIVGAVAVLLAGCGGGAQASTPAGPAVLEVSGSLVIRTQSWSTDCTGGRGYEDVTAGAQVTVTDGAGAVIGLGQLLAPTFTPDSGIPPNPEIGSQWGVCGWPFVVTNVPAGRGFYGIEVAHRGAVRYPEADLTSRPVQLRLG